MTSGWFLTLKAIHEKRPLPVKLFSIDRCFRREQKEDASHLMTYHSASCVWMDDEISLDVGMAVSESLLQHFGFENLNSSRMRRNLNITSPPPRQKSTVTTRNLKNGLRWPPSVCTPP